MNILKKLFEILSSKKITLFLLNLLGLLLVISLILMNTPAYQTITSTFYSISKPFLIGFIVAFVLEAPISLIDKHATSRSVAIGIVYGVSIFSIILLVWLLVPMLYTSISQLVPSLGSGLMEIERLLETRLEIDLSPLIIYINDSLTTMLKNNLLINTTLDVIMHTIRIFVDFILYLIISIYMSFNYYKIRAFFKSILKRVDEDFIVYVQAIENSLHLYVRAFFIGAVVQGVLCSLMYLFVGQTNWLILGIVSAISCIFPYIGPVIANGLGLIISLNLPTSAILLLCVFIFIQSNIVSYIVTPKIYSSQVDLSIMAVLFGILTGGTLFGALGMIISMPILVTCKAIYHTYVQQNPI